MLLMIAPLVQAKPFDVMTETSIRHGNWYPLPVADMKAAAADTALDVISSGGIFRIVNASSGSRGRLKLELSLIGPAETAKLTLKLDLPDQPSYVATSSISVRGLDHQGIYAAFEHIGRSAGQRLNDKIQALVVEPQPDLTKQASTTHPSGQQPGADDPQLRRLYDEAQRQKHRFHYQQARILFEQVAAANGPGSDQLQRLAEDELRYGLPLFEAKQWLVAMGRPYNTPQQIEQAQNNASNLFRQILAENRDSFERTREAQRFLDELSVSRRALQHARQASTLSRAHHIKIMLLQHLNWRGKCPNETEVRKLLPDAGTDINLIAVNGGIDQRQYRFQDKKMDAVFKLQCRNNEVKIIP